MSIAPVRGTRPRPEGPGTTSTYTALARAIRDAGLLQRRRGFYISLFVGLVLALGGVLAGILVLGDSWFVLLVAGALGIVLTQFAFLSHEASHRQVFDSGKVNDAAGKILASAFVGMSYSWWMHKHSRHHANPNQVGRDPDIENDFVSFTEADAAGTRGLLASLNRFQGYLFLPLLLLEGVNLHYISLRAVFSKSKDPSNRTVERVMMVARLGLYVGLLFWLMPPGIAAAFLGVQLAVFGFYMGGSFAPNHIGMAIVPAGSRLDFLSKQVLTSRNVRGGLPLTALMGGLNYQVEHHLFPNMPRPALAKARLLVREHCRANAVPYTETTLAVAWRRVLAYMNEVGAVAPDPFFCPMVARYRV
jgi:fatty acid desaturase